MGLLEKQLGLLPVTSNQQMLAQALKSRSKPAMSLKPVTPQGLLDNAALATSPVPFVGDAIGLAADANRFYNEPESRTPLNFGLAALGLIPFVPPLVSAGLGKFAQSQGKTLANLPSGPARNQAGAIVYHGSPHKFDAFDSSKIGTGEGAQAYGHGLYFAENPKVAEGYRYVHGGGVPAADAFSYMGRDVENISGIGRAALRSGSAADSGMSVGLRGFPPDGASSSIANFGVGATPAKLKDVFPDFSRPQIDALQALINARGDKDKAVSMLNNKGRLEAAKIAEETASQFKVNKMAGPDTHLYKVDLPDEAIAKMLDWDKPLSQQAPNLASHVDILMAKIKNDFPTVETYLKKRPEKATGEFLYRAVEQKIGKEGATNYFKEIGVPGVRYLDGGSRSASQGTSNFVVFPGNEGLLKILERQ